MSTKSKPIAIEKDTEQDLDTFERLPGKTKELMKLKEEDEKATGPEQVETIREIEKEVDKSQT